MIRPLTSFDRARAHRPNALETGHLGLSISATGDAGFHFTFGKRSFERSEMPEVVRLQVLALQRAGESVEFQIILGRALGAAVVWKDAVLYGLLEEGQNLLFQLRRQVF